MSRRRINSRLRIQFLALLMLIGMGTLGLRLWWIQVAHGAEWTAQLRGSSQATVRIPSVRGEIKDRNGLTLVQNRGSYEVDFYLPEMVKGYRDRFGSPPLTEYRATINGMPKDQKEPVLSRSLTVALSHASTISILPAITMPANSRDTIATTPKFPFPTLKTSIFRRWRNFPSTMSDYPG